MASLPRIAALAAHLEEAELATTAAVTRGYDSRTDAAMTKLVSQLDPDAGGELIDALDRCGEAALEEWCALFAAAGTPALQGSRREAEVPRSCNGPPS